MAKRTSVKMRGREMASSFASDLRGATAVEFALVATPFLGMLFAIIQTALLLWSQQVLETAVADASRQLYTGTFQNENAGSKAATLPGKFKALVCGNVQALLDCSKIDVDVRVMASTTTTTPAPPITNGVYDASSFGFQQPAGNDIVLVRASMEYPTFVRILNPTTTLLDGNTLIMASATFRAEPF